MLRRLDTLLKGVPAWRRLRASTRVRALLGFENTLWTRKVVDLVIAEHVFEHLLRPDEAARNILTMLVPGGHALVVTPFLYRVHGDPYDCTRWTETGLRQFLASCGFALEAIHTGSWGNRACIEATFRREFRLFNRYLHSLKHEPDFPVVVWALARR